MKHIKKNSKIKLQIIGFCVTGLVGLLLLLFSFHALNGYLNDDIGVSISELGGFDAYDQVSSVTGFISGDVQFLLVCDTIGTTALIIGIQGVRKNRKKWQANRHESGSS